MEGIFFVLIGGALFSQSGYVLRLYSEGRIMGVTVAALGVMTLGTIMFGASVEATLLTGSEPVTSKEALAHTTVLKGLMIVWAVYAIGVGAHGLWDFEERAIGFFSGVVAVVSLVAFLYFVRELQTVYSDEVWLSMSGGALALTVLSAITVFYLAFQQEVLRPVAGWFMLLGGGVVVAIGLAILSTAII